MTLKETIKRYLLFIISLFISAEGIALTRHAELGVSPISSIANVVSYKLPSLSFGVLLIIWNCILILVQIIVLRKDFNPVLTLPICFLAGAVVGTLTGLIHVKLKVRDLLSGIIMMTALYTVNLRIAGRANLPIYNKVTIFENDLVKSMPEAILPFKNVVVIVIITFACKSLTGIWRRKRACFFGQ